MRFFPIALLNAAIVVVALVPVRAATPERPAAFCFGKYALCIRALCTHDPSSNDTVKCACAVENGWSMGPGNCQDRETAAKNGTPISTYSNRFNSEDKTLTCADPHTEWAWCYGSPCTVDPNDPTKAICTCPVKTGPMQTLGGRCDRNSCNQVWSAATPKDDHFANNHFKNYMTKHHPNYPANEPAVACYSKRI